MTAVTLSWPELRFAAYKGIDRFVRNRAAQRTPLDGQSVDRALTDDVIGAIGECVIARHTATYWTGDLAVPDAGAPDVGPFHVRTSLRRDARLILHERDDDNGMFVLVVPAAFPTFRVVGWCYGRDGKQPEHWQTSTGRPCYFVPHEKLRPIEDAPGRPS